MDKIRVAIVGVGNCASSLVQGIFHYNNSKNAIGLKYKKIGVYLPSDIEIVGGFDIDSRKVELDVSEAIFQQPNNTKIFHKEIPHLGAKVYRGPTLDGFPEHMFNFDEEERFVESNLEAVDVIKVLKKIKPDILINYLPVGSENASRFYANCCLEAGVSFINAIPTFICSTKEFSERFKAQGLVCIGDDIKAQLGATIIHRSLADLFMKRGVEISRTYQLNTGGNTDFLNMYAKSRTINKKISKTEAVRSQISHNIKDKNIHIGPSDYVPWQEDNKIAFIRIEGKMFGEIDINVEARLSVEDSPNSAGIMIDVIRVAKLALDNSIFGYLDEISSYGFKHPMNQISDLEAEKRLEDFIKKNG